MKTVYLALMMACLVPACDAGVLGQSAKAVMKKATAESVEAIAKNAVRHAGTKVAAEAAEVATKAVGHQAARSAMQPFTKAVAGSPQLADDLARVTANVTARNQRRLAILGPAIEQSGQATQIASRLTQGNADMFIDTLWSHRGKLATAAGVTALLVHGDNIVEATTEHVAKPVIEGTFAYLVSPLSWLLFSGAVMVGSIAFMAALAYLFGGEATDRVVGRIRGVARLLGARW